MFGDWNAWTTCQYVAGFQFARASPSRQQFWCGNVCTTKRRATLPIRARTSTGQRSFAVFGRATWNSLSLSLRAPELSLSIFKRLLKTQLFQHAWTIVRRRCDWTASSAPHTNIRTHLIVTTSISWALFYTTKYKWRFKWYLVEWFPRNRPKEASNYRRSCRWLNSACLPWTRFLFRNGWS